MTTTKKHKKRILDLDLYIEERKILLRNIEKDLEEIEEKHPEWDLYEED